MDAIPGVLKNKSGREDESLTLVVQLKQEGGEKFRHSAYKTYRLDTRGLKKLKADIEAWRGSELDADELDFDPQREFVNNSVEVVVKHGTHNGRPIARFTTFKKSSEKIKPENYKRDAQWEKGVSEEDAAD